MRDTQSLIRNLSSYQGDICLVTRACFEISRRERFSLEICLFFDQFVLECEKQVTCASSRRFFSESTGMHASNGMVPTTISMFLRSISASFLWQKKKKNRSGRSDPFSLCLRSKNRHGPLQSSLNYAYSRRPCLP